MWRASENGILAIMALASLRAGEDEDEMLSAERGPSLNHRLSPPQSREVKRVPFPNSVRLPAMRVKSCPRFVGSDQFIPGALIP